MVQAVRRDAPGPPGPEAAALGHPALVVVTACALVAVVVELTNRSLPRGPSALLVVVFGAMAVVPIALAREHATAAGWATVAGAALLVAYDQPLPWAVAVAAGITAYFLARARAPLLTAAVIVAYAVITVAAPQPSRASSTFATAAVAAAAAGLGSSLRWRERAAQLTATAHHAERTLLEHATLEERARIARELHDVVAHHISMIAVQAEAARLLIPDLAPDGQRRLTDIGDTARAALTEMRRLLGVLREGGATVTPTRRPQPGLQQLDALVDEARGVTGSTMRLIVHGPLAPLDPGVDLTAYRIVQEALTNARRHAPGAAIDIELDYRPEALEVRVRDSGLGSTSHPSREPALEPASAGGHGLNGMRERTAMLGGSISAGPLPQGGFAIAAVLPNEPSS